MTSAKGLHGQTCFYRPRAVSRSETRVSTNGEPSLFFNTIQAFYQRERNKKTMRRILHGPVGRTPRHVIRNFRAKYRSSDLPVFDIKQNLAKKLDPTLKSSHLNEGVTYLTSFLHTKAQISTPFLRDKTLKSCTRVLHAYPEASPAGFRFVFIFFFAQKKLG